MSKNPKKLIEKKDYKEALSIAKKRHRKGKIDEYLEILDLLIEAKYLPAFEEKGQYYLYYNENHDNNDYGEKYFNSYLKIEPHSINAICGKSMALSEKGNFKDSIKLMKKALDSYENFSFDENPRISKSDVNMGYIELLLKANRNTEALNELDKFEEKYPQNKKLNLYKGILLVEDDKNEEALKYLNKSLEEELTVLAFNAKGNALYNLKEYKEALKCFKRCIQFGKEVTDVDLITNYNYKAAFCEINLGNYDEGIKYLNKTIKYLDNLGRLPDNIERIYQKCNFEKEKLLKEGKTKNKEFSKFKFLSSKVAIVVLILFIIGYFILTYFNI